MSRLNKSVLFKTSLASDVQNSGGVLAIAGCLPVKTSNIVDIKQIKSKAEVAQVVHIAFSTYTPTADTTYKVRLEFINARRDGFVSPGKEYAYTTPDVITKIGSSAALQREYIHLDIVAKIMADYGALKIPISAVTDTGGAGITLTDDAGYFPVNSVKRKGATQVTLLPSPDGSGWTNAATENLVTTAAVYSFGVGQNLLDAQPIQDPSLGGLISGNFDAPKTAGIAGTYATAGQIYDAFLISALKLSPAHAVSDQFAYETVEQLVYVDNGTGSATTNLAGFKAFEREMLRNLFTIVYGKDPKIVNHWFDKQFILQADTGVTPYTGTLAGTANVLNVFLTPDGALSHTNIGTQTIFSPVLDATGLLIDQDDNAGDGAHYSANQQTLGVQEFIVGKEEFSVSARVVAANWTNTHFMLGFRKKEAYTADYNDYNDLAAIGTRVSGVNDVVATQGILTNAATVETVSTTAISTDAVSADLEVRVDINGLVSCYVNNVKYPVYSVGTTALILTAGLHMIPFFQHVNINSADAGVSISHFVAVASKDWRIV